MWTSPCYPIYRYPGLTQNSSRADFQHRLHQTHPTSKCPDTAGHFSPTLPTFADALDLNYSQRHRYSTLRESNSASLGGKSFKALSAAQKQQRRHEVAKHTAHELRKILNASQWRTFTNRSAALRRPPSVHIAAGLARDLEAKALPTHPQR